MAAEDLVVLLLLSLLGLPPNTQAANVVLAAARDQHVVEVAEADWAVVLELVSLLLGFGGVLRWIHINTLDILLLKHRINTHLVPFLHGLRISLLDLLEDARLVVDVLGVVVAGGDCLQRPSTRLINKPKFTVPIHELLPPILIICAALADTQVLDGRILQRVVSIRVLSVI